jgi:hypothetical protein
MRLAKSKRDGTNKITVVKGGSACQGVGCEDGLGALPGS